MIKFEISKPTKKRWYSLEDTDIDDENFRPEDFKDKLLRPVVINRKNWVP